MQGTIAFEKIQSVRPALNQLSINIWRHPEGPYQEVKACGWTAALLEQEGFCVETGACSLPTAIIARWGSGHPVIGFFGEYDALPGLSQQLCPQQEPFPNQEYGHGCGHNLLGAAHVGAVIGLKEEMERTGCSGTIVFYGCPAEELLTGKPFMAREHAFDDLDLAISFHPATVNFVYQGINAGVQSVEFHYYGKSAHAGADPQNGRSALDALELTNVGAQYLREHVTEDVRIHYVIKEGGTAPNIVPDKASSWYMIRALSMDNLNSVYERLVKTAKGAADMTETTVEVKYLGGCYPTMQNQVLADLVYDCMHQIPWERFDRDDQLFAKALTAPVSDSCDKAARFFQLEKGGLLYEGIRPMRASNSSGSFDMGDVCHIVPTVMFSTACRPVGVPNHHWRTTASSGSGIGEKGMINAAKIMALFGIRAMTDPSVCEKAREEFLRSMDGQVYHCSIPDGLSPFPSI